MRTVLPATTSTRWPQHCTRIDHALEDARRVNGDNNLYETCAHGIDEGFNAWHHAPFALRGCGRDQSVVAIGSATR